MLMIELRPNNIVIMNGQHGVLNLIYIWMMIVLIIVRLLKNISKKIESLKPKMNVRIQPDKKLATTTYSFEEILAK
ncbi:MAG: hypothetical protein AMJ79_04555 [Phycisphaerae bacterium SM23_30]|nr:MAG: hypothetical protein AMJ79_04555 [Phycisphaerae bacterium SM23_30]